MDFKTVKLESIKQKMFNATSEEYNIIFDRILNILEFLNGINQNEERNNYIDTKLNSLKKDRDYIYYKSIELVFKKDAVANALPDILSNLLSNSVDTSQNILVDYITILAFSCFSTSLIGDGYLKTLSDYLLSQFRLDWLLNNWNYIENKIKELKKI